MTHPYSVSLTDMPFAFLNGPLAFMSRVHIPHSAYFKFHRRGDISLTSCWQAFQLSNRIIGSIMTQSHIYTVSYRWYKLSASGFDDQTVLKEPEQKKAFCPKVQIIWLIDPEKIGGTKFFLSRPLPWSKCQGENQSPDTSLLASPQKGLINASQGCWGLFWGQQQYHHYQDVGAADWKYFARNKKCLSLEMLTLFENTGRSRFPDKTLIHWY